MRSYKQCLENNILMYQHLITVSLILSLMTRFVGIFEWLGHIWAHSSFGPLTHLGPWLIWAPTPLEPNSFGPRLIWTPTHLGPNTFGPQLISFTFLLTVCGENKRLEEAITTFIDYQEKGDEGLCTNVPISDRQSFPRICSKFEIKTNIMGRSMLPDVYFLISLA